MRTSSGPPTAARTSRSKVEFYKLTSRSSGAAVSPNLRDVPIYFAAVNKLMARYCGEVADGLLGHPLASPIISEK